MSPFTVKYFWGVFVTDADGSKFLCTRPTDRPKKYAAAAYVSWRRQQVEMRKNASAPRLDAPPRALYFTLHYILTFEGWQIIYSAFAFNDGTQHELKYFARGISFRILLCTAQSNIIIEHQMSIENYPRSNSIGHNRFKYSSSIVFENKAASKLDLSE